MQQEQEAQRHKVKDTRINRSPARLACRTYAHSVRVSQEGRSPVHTRCPGSPQCCSQDQKSGACKNPCGATTNVCIMRMAFRKRCLMLIWTQDTSTNNLKSIHYGFMYHSASRDLSLTWNSCTATYGSKMLGANRRCRWRGVCGLIRNHLSSCRCWFLWWCCCLDCRRFHQKFECCCCCCHCCEWCCGSC